MRRTGAQQPRGSRGAIVGGCAEISQAKVPPIEKSSPRGFPGSTGYYSGELRSRYLDRSRAKSSVQKTAGRGQPGMVVQAPLG